MNILLHEDVIDRLKQADLDRYRSAMFAVPAIRDRLILLYAFHMELAKVPELVSEPMIGQIRYQWWREAIAEIYESHNVRKHEITTPLRTMLLAHEIPRYWVDQLIDGRERDMDPRPFENLSQAQDYCAQTSGVLMKIAVKLCGVEPNNAVEAAGTSWGMTGLSRAYGFYHKTMLSELSFNRICAQAGRLYEQAQSGLNGFENEAFPAVAYTALIGPYLKKMARPDFDPKSQTITYLAFAKQMRLLKSVLIGKV